MVIPDIFSHNYLFEILITYHKIVYISYYNTLICINLKFCLLSLNIIRVLYAYEPIPNTPYDVVCFYLYYPKLY